MAGSAASGQNSCIKPLCYVKITRRTEQHHSPAEFTNRVSLRRSAPGVDFATAVALRRMATSTGATPAYLLAPEVGALLWYMPDQRHHMLFATMWNTGKPYRWKPDAHPESFDTGWSAPFVRCFPEKCGRAAGNRQKIKCARCR